MHKSLRVGLKSSLTALFGLMFLLLMHAAAHAAAPLPTNTLPRSVDFTQGSEVWLTTAKYDGVNYFLDSPNSTVRVYSKSQIINLTITNGRMGCGSPGPDAGATEAEATTKFDFYQLDPNPISPNDYTSNPYAQLTPRLGGTTSNTLPCGTARPIQIKSNAKPSKVPGFKDVYAFEIQALWTGGGAGWNSFKLQVDNGWLSYYAGSGDHFALKANGSGLPGQPGNFHMGFAPNCNLQDSDGLKPVTLKWFDADAGQANQAGQFPVRTQVIEYDQAGGQTRVQNLNIYTGNNVGGQSGATINGVTYPTITIRAHHKYEWVWYNIYSANGIQFQLPTDSFNTLINFDTGCSAGNLGATCTANPASIGNLAPNQGPIAITVTAKNTGDVGWDPGSANPLYQMRKSASGVVQGSIPLSSSSTGASVVNPTSTGPAPTTTNFVFNVFAPPAAGTKRVSFQMESNSNVFGTTCHVDLTVGAAAVPTAWIDPQCGNSVIHMTSKTTNTWHPGGLAAKQQIGTVPAKVHVQDVTDGRNWDFLWPGGVSNGGDSSPQSTFGLGNSSGNTMWPNHDYVLSLFLQANTAPTDSLTYQNNGIWNPAGSPSYYGVASLGDFSTPNDCLTFGCGNTTPVDVEPGQTAGQNGVPQLSANITYSNDTNETYQTNPSGGFYLHINTSGGIIGAPGDISGGPITPGNGSITANFDARIDSTGSYSVTLMFQGNPFSPGTCNDQPVTPSTRPYLQVWGGDINTGGGFETPNASGAFSCANSYPDYVSPTTKGDANYGGIKTFGADDGTYGSLSDFGALSLGAIAKNSSAHINFGAQPAFSNSVAPEGQLNSSPPSYCLTDFYDKTQESPNSIGAPGSITGLGSQQYIVNGTVTNLGGGTIAAGQKTVLYVNGDVTITSNITYANWDVNTPDSAPSFALIVKGNINIAPGVTRVDGLYIAQPTAPGVDGIFNTCATNNGNSFCNQQFVANGAVIARDIVPIRAVGTLSPDANPGFNPPPGHLPAEIFNYIPSMVVSTPNFAPVYNSLQGLFSLPPVF